MRDRRKTIESLRRLAERPGTQHEGETAQLVLDQMLGSTPKGTQFRAEDFPQMTEVWYAQFCYLGMKDSCRSVAALVRAEIAKR